MSSWLPQNIQKRLLLYVLQQISLFSEIDLSNLDVSLGSQSNFTFSDLNLNLSEIQIPNFSLNKGTLEHLSIRLGVAGSVNVFGDGVTFELSPSEPIEDDTSDQWAASLSKSVLDLTQSMLGSGIDSSSIVDSIHESSAKPSTTLDSMRNKVLQIALSNLSMQMRRTKIDLKITHEQFLTIEIDDISLSSVDSKRCVDLNGIRFTSSTNIKDRESTGSVHQTKHDLMSSLYQSKLEQSVYMSAFETFDDVATEADVYVFLEIDKLSLNFHGLTSIDDLGIHDVVIKLNFLKLKLERLHVFVENVLSLPLIRKLFENCDSDDIALDFNSYKRFVNEQKIEQENLFSAFLLFRIELELSPDLSILLDDVSLKRGDRGTNTFAISHVQVLSKGKKSIITSNSTQSFLYMTSNETSSLNRIFLNNDFDFLLDDNILVTSSRMISEFMASYERATRKFHIITKTSKRSNLVFKSCNVNLSYIRDGFEIQLMFSPISSLSLSEIFKVENIKVFIVANSKKTKLADIFDLSFSRNEGCIQTKSFNTKFVETIYATKYFGTVGHISLTSSHSEVLKVLNTFEELSVLFSEELRNVPMSKPDIALKKSVRLLSSSSILNNRAVISKCVLEIKSLTSIFSMRPGTVFEKILIELGPVKMIQNKSGSFLAVLDSLNIKNIRAAGSQELLSSLKTNSSKPRLIVSYSKSSKLKLYLLGLRFLYEAKWLESIESSTSPSDQALSKKNSSISVDLRLQDCSISMHPYRLSTAMTLVLPRAIVNFNFPSITFSLRTVEILLIDDFRKAKKGNHDDASVTNIYEKLGYTKLGKIDMASINVDMSSFVKLNIKVEKVDLSLCSDSSNAFIQTLLDLKPSITFPDSLKYQTDCPIAENTSEIDEDYFCPSVLLNNDNNGGDEILSVATDESLLVDEEHFNLNQFEVELQDVAESIVRYSCDLKVNIGEINIKLYDGYDWKYTRKEITNTIHQFEQIQHEDKNVESATIFDSFHISASMGSKTDIQSAINIKINNEEIDGKVMRLRPSSKYKILLKSSDINIRFLSYLDEGVDVVSSYSFVPSSSILNNTTINIGQLEIIDNVPTSTWNKFLFRMKNRPQYHDLPMFTLQISLVRPTIYLYATELLISLKSVPLRLHVDQDTLEFLKCFAQFKDHRFELIEDYPDIAYIQRLEINSIELMLDYKPKKVDYVGLRSGQTKELMNFFILDGAKITLQHIILYGVEGFIELEQLLSNIWTPYITKCQLPGVISGLGPFKSLLGLGKGARALVSVPSEQYRQDGRLGRSLQKGATVFLKTTSGEIIKLGVKLTSGAQAVLENTEEILGGKGSSGRIVPVELVDGDEKIEALIEESILKTTTLYDTSLRNKRMQTSLLVPENDAFRVVSLYADQPKNLSSGLQDAYNSVSRSLSIAFNSMKQAREDLRDVRGAQDAALTVAKAAPVAVIRPLIGVTEAVSKTLQGLNNQIDHRQSSDLKDKYKSQKLRGDNDV